MMTSTIHQSKKSPPPPQEQLQILLFENPQTAQTIFFKYKPRIIQNISPNAFKGQNHFCIGIFHVFTKDNKSYTAELHSKPDLNQEIPWNRKKILNLIHEELKHSQITEEVDDLISIKYIFLYILEDGQRVTLFKIKLNEDFGNSCEKELWKQFNLYLEQGKRNIEQKNKGLRLVQQQREKALDRFESTIDTQKLRKEKIKRKLSALMNEKQAKLIEASKGEVTKFQYEFKDSTGKFINTGRGQSKMQIQPQSHELSQDDKMMPSLREPVLFGSLFEPSQL